ncbi:glycoside hydrolase family 3 protein [Termitidicoccus mucosus]|uniref:beta-N-acetylhexosaminidase n=1 Tax=Termitidicoccus mucosus TaxID=1184151 RepID=A0A178IKR0_9BACT|nr:hypothetical protein AW736_07805 [Opitutaceae bacterium TSB47]
MIPTSRFRLSISSRARALAGRLTMRQLLLQVTVPALVHLDRNRLDGYGGIFLHGTTQAERDALLARLRPLCPVEPFVVADIEYGPRDLPEELGCEFGPMMGHAMADDPELTLKISRATGLISRARGFTWALGPCSDLLADPDSPMVSTRSPGARPERAAEIAWAFARGLQEHGLLATAKHFPGDGFGTLDQHLTTPVNPLDTQAWRDGPGFVFQHMINRGIRAIMPGHIALPALDEPDAPGGLHPPASLSRRLLTDLLRHEMGFEGLVISDAVNMTGFCGFMNYYDACARFLEAGGDVLLFAKVDERFFTEMERCLREKKLTEDTLRDRAARIIAAKESAGLLDTPLVTPPAPDLGSLDLPTLADQLVSRSVGVIRDRRGFLARPITAGTRVLHVIISNYSERHQPLLSYFTELLRGHSPLVTEWIDPGCDRLFEAARDGAFDLIVASIAGGIEYGANVIRLHGPVARNMMYGWMKLGPPVVFVAHHHPYLIYEYDAAVDCCVATFGSTRQSLRRLARGLAGIEPLPVLKLWNT